MFEPAVWFFYAIVLLAVATYDVLRFQTFNWVNKGMVCLTFVCFFFFSDYFAIGMLRLAALWLLVYGLNQVWQKTWAEGDRDIFYWVIPIVGLFSDMGMPLFLGALMTLYLIEQGLMKLFKIERLPGTPIIFGAYLLATLLPVF